MAVTQSRDNRTLIAGADLSASQFLFAQLDAAADAVLCGNGDATIGVIEVPSKLGDACTVTHSGKVVVKCGGTVSIAGDVASDASGKAVDATAGAVIIGYAYEGGLAEELISIELVLGGNAKA